MGVETETSLSISARMANTVASGALLCMETAAQYSIGQTILTLVDRFLWIVEKSSQWSLPCQEEGTGNEENGKSFGKFELVRPLPWIFFLPTLIMLRFVRIGLNVGTFVFGYPAIEPCGTVKVLQKSRRRLRTIKLNGIKYLRHRKDGGKMKTPTPDEKSTTESATSPTHVEPKRKYSELSSDGQPSDDSEEETIEAKIDRLAAVDDSLDDEDFNPDELSNSDDNSSSTTGDSSSVSATELQNLQDEANLIMHRAFAGVAEVIKEEPEPSKRTDAEEIPVNSEEYQEYGSPCKHSDDGDTAFYSPISSNSSSPDRTVPVVEQRNPQWSGGNGVHAANTCRNGEVNSEERKSTTGTAADKRTNGHAEEKGSVPTNVSTKGNKAHHRGRRAAHASRKKK